MTRTRALSEFVGILPAAGIASRLHPSRYLKELLPVAYIFNDAAGTARPVPVISLSLRALKVAGIRRSVVTISDKKPELMRYLGDGSDFDQQLVYVQQTTASGLGRAVDLAYDWTRECYGCLLLPDTIVQPTQALSRLRHVAEEERPDLVLGVFPTAMPEQLGPVRFDAANRVLEVQDKPKTTDVRNSWAMAIWSPDFSALLHEAIISGSTTNLGEVFNRAVQVGMNVKAVWFPEGSFIDIGTVKGIAQMLEIGKMVDDSEFAEPPVPAAIVASR
jgi:glucose-1-phosphate thymidylyltransferase